ncbi:MAG TPA: tetratricopeptide repeat protein, partial [Candidatus Obscuribacter sp.]|nr:tetratricopeptide repeat protein [Candidatus Obscuribacter sp.]
MGIAKAGLSRAVGILALTTMVLQALSLPLLPCYAQGASTGMAPSGPPDAKAADVASRALQLAMDGNTSEARDLLTTANKDQLKKSRRNPEIPYFLALFEAREGKLKDAIQHLSDAKELYGQEDSKNFLRLALVSKRLGDCLYKESNSKAALAEYATAMKLA